MGIVDKFLRSQADRFQDDDEWAIDPMDDPEYPWDDEDYLDDEDDDEDDDDDGYF